MTLHIFFKPVINKKKRCTLNFVLKTSAISYFIFFIWLSEPHLWDLQAPPVGLVIHSENHKNLLVRLSFYPGTRFMFQCRIIAQPTSLMTLKNKNWVHIFYLYWILSDLHRVKIIHKSSNTYTCIQPLVVLKVLPF